jgi:magnesium transporter
MRLLVAAERRARPAPNGESVQMNQPPNQDDIRELIAAGEFFRLKQTLTEMDIHDVADLLVRMPEEKELAIAFRLLPKEKAAEIFGEFEPEQQEKLLATFNNTEVADLINHMPPDDRTELLEELPGQVAQKLMNYLRGEELTMARALLAYPEGSIGRVMTPEYVAVRKHWTIQRVLEHLRRVAADRETFYIVFVVDDNWKLVDEIYLEDIVLSEPTETVEELMDGQYSCLTATDDQETAVEAFKKYDAIALPVVDTKGTLVGIVTFDDVMDIQEEESTEDMQRMTGMGPLEYSYFGAGFGRMLKSRLPWLLMLLAAETAAVLVLNGFQKWLAVLAMFMPLINATAGNTGSQVAGLMIRGLAVQEIDVRDWVRVFAREVGRGMLMGVILAVMAFGIVLIVGDPADTNLRTTGLAVGMAMIVAVTLANLLGAMLPLMFKRIGVDPAVTSGPFIACVMDVSSILIFFTIASSILTLAS